MRIVVASGKGGTGKTLVATSLALVARSTGPVALLDADVEAPNAALFVAPEFSREWDVQLLAPVVDQERCVHCGRCAEVCRFHAIASLPQKTLVFTDLCHGCGSCMLNCPEEAISEYERAIGTLASGTVPSGEGRKGENNDLLFAQGTLSVGEAMATPIIRALGKHAATEGWDAERTVIVDAPPGSACPVIEALSTADVALLVTEPTPFGLHDLKLAVEVALDVLHRPVAVVINKDGKGDSEVDAYCRERGIPVLLRIPLDRKIATVYSTGQPLVTALPEYRPAFARLLESVIALAKDVAS